MGSREAGRAGGTRSLDVALGIVFVLMAVATGILGVLGLTAGLFGRGESPRFLLAVGVANGVAAAAFGAGAWLALAGRRKPRAWLAIGVVAALLYAVGFLWPWVDRVGTSVAAEGAGALPGSLVEHAGMLFRGGLLVSDLTIPVGLGLILLVVAAARNLRRARGETAGRRTSRA